MPNPIINKVNIGGQEFDIGGSGGGGGQIDHYYETEAEMDEIFDELEEGASVDIKEDDGNGVLSAGMIKYNDGTQQGTTVQAAIDGLKSDLTETIIAQVTCDGIKSRSTIFNEVWSQISTQTEKLKNALISYEGNQYRCMVFNANEANFSQVNADANGVNVYTITCKTSGSTMRYSHVGNNPSYTDISAGIPTANTVFYVIIPAHTFN